MTLLNFESSFRAEKIAKAREMYLKGQVIELQKAPKAWIGTIRIGLYKVQILLNGIAIENAKCPCDSRSHSGYCEHKLAVLFALRKELDLFPALTSSSQKLPPSNTELQEQLAIINHPDSKLLQKDIQRFTRIANNMLKEAKKNILTGDCKTAFGDCVEVIRHTSTMDIIMSNDYKEEEELISRSLKLMADAIEKAKDEELLEHIAHDLRVEVLRNFRSDEYLFEQYMSLLRPISGQGNRHEKFNKVINALNRIDKFYP